MKVVEHTSDRLVLRYLPIRGWLLAGSLLTTLLILLSIIYFGGTRSQLTCQRSPSGQGACQLRERVAGIEGELVQEISLEEFTGVKMVQVPYELSEGNQTTGYTIALVTPKEEIVFQSLQRDKTQIESATTQINEFLKNSRQPSVEILYRFNMAPPSTLIWYFLAFFVIPAILILIFCDLGVLTYTFDRTTGSFTITRQALSRKTLETHKLALIGKVVYQEAVPIEREVLKLPGIEGRTVQVTSGVVLVLADDREIPIWGLESMASDRQQALAGTIAAFLGL
ncbi:MAG: hypothetical protein SFW36_10150 [Leptolyngbyaceae cyanobacterium bins.59]|nr:hypothetical protein [Leptolyngbyaceae cyanobacterium bins.59]